MEHWREMAGAVPWTLLSVAIDTCGLIDTVGSAHTHLGAVAQTLRHRVKGAEPSDFRDALAGRFGAAALDGALRELARLDVLHHGAGYAYNLYGGWQRHSHEAFFHAMDARRKLRAAAWDARAAEDAFRVRRSFPGGSPDAAAWRSAALQLALHAAVSAALACRALRRMRDAVALEFYDAWRTSWTDAAAAAAAASASIDLCRSGWSLF